MKKVFYILISVLFLFGCSKTQQNDTEYYYSFTDSTGKEVILQKAPKRIAILFSSYADIWVTAGGKVDITVGESIERGFADISAILVDEGSGHSTINTELLIASEPDLIIGTADYECQRKTVEFTSEHGIPSALFKVETFNYYLTVLKIFCDITQRADLYEKYGISVKEQIDDILTNSSLEQNKNTEILFVRAGSSAKSTKAKNSEQHFVCGMIDELGFTNIADEAKQLLDGLSIETVVAKQPEYILISLMGNEENSTEYVKSLLSSAGWKDLDCVKKGNYVFLPKKLFHYKPNSRWAEAYSFLLNILQTE